MIATPTILALIAVILTNIVFGTNESSAMILENSHDFSAERQKSEEKDLKISEIEKSLQNSESHLKTARKALSDIKYLSVSACTTIDQKRIFADKGLHEIEAAPKKISKKAEFQIKKEKSQS